MWESVVVGWLWMVEWQRGAKWLYLLKLHVITILCSFSRLKVFPPIFTKMKNFVITLVLGAAIGFGCSKALDQSAVAETPMVLQELIKPGTRFGTAFMHLEEGADVEAFEDHLMTDWLPKWKKAYDLTGTGTKVFLTKVVQGENAGDYGWITIFPDDDTRSLLFTPEGEFTESLSNAVEEAEVHIQPDFPGYAGWTHHGDVIVLGEE